MQRRLEKEDLAGGRRTGCLLLGAKRHDGIDARGSGGRPDARRGRNRDQQQTHEAKGERIARRCPHEKLLQGSADGNRPGNPQQQPNEQLEKCSPDEEPHDLWRPGPSATRTPISCVRSVTLCEVTE
jgi:hypothetical protein